MAQAAAPCSTDEPCVVVEQVAPDRTTVLSRTPIPLSTLVDRADHGAGEYQVREVPHGATHPSERFSSGTSVREVLAEAGVPIGTVTQVDVQGPGRTTTLDARDLVPPGPDSPFSGQGYNDPNPAPDFYPSGDQIGFIRPLRQDTGDVNRFDLGQTVSGGAYTVRVYTTGAPALRPAVTADRTKVAAGKPVRFSIYYLDGRGPTDPARYSWDFGDATAPDCSPTTNDPASPTHRYAAASRGTVEVTVSVCGGGGSSGRSAPVTITVGKASTPSSGQTPGGSGPSGGPTSGPATGPNRSSGKTRGGTPSDRDGTGGAGTSGTNGTSGTTEKKQQASKGKKKVARAEGGVAVSGVLLDADAAKAVPLQAPESAPVAAATARRATELPRDWRWLLALVPVALLLAGVARQTPWLARRLPQPPWRNE